MSHLRTRTDSNTANDPSSSFMGGASDGQSGSSRSPCRLQVTSSVHHAPSKFIHRQHHSRPLGPTQFPGWGVHVGSRTIQYLMDTRNSIIRSVFCVLVVVTYWLQSRPRVNLPQQQKVVAQEQHKRRLKARLVHNLTLHGLHGDGSDAHYRCTLGEHVSTPNYNKWGGLVGAREALRPPLNDTGIFDFHVDISSTDLKIMLVGNSLSEQLSAGLEEALCYSLSDKLATGMDREPLRNKTSCRITDVPDPENEWYKSKPVVSSITGGIIMNVMETTNFVDTAKMWNVQDPAVSALVQTLKEEVVLGSTRDQMPLIDVFVYQFPSGHINLDQFHERHLKEAVTAASELFGASMVIFPTVAAMNNVKDTVAWNLVNRRIRSFVSMYEPLINSTVKSVQTLDYAGLINEYMILNAGMVGIPSNETFVHRKGDRWRTLTSLACTSKPFDEDKGCKPGMISLDGIHLCPQTVHGRINAGLLCLLDCKFNNLHPLGPHNQSCSNQCNEKYMTLSSVMLPTSGDLLLTN